MVSMKWVGAAALVLVAICGVQATYVSSTPLVTCCNYYYNKWQIDLKANVSVVGTICNVIYGAVGLVGNLLSSLLSFLGILNPTLGSFLAAPKSDGDSINLLLRLCITIKPFFDKCHPGLGTYFVQAASASLIIGVSQRSTQYSGLCFNTLDKSKRAQWLQQLGCTDLKQNWNNWLASEQIDITALVAVKAVLFNQVDALVNLVVSGVGDILDQVIIIVYTVVCLLQNLIGGVLQVILDLGWNYCGGLFSTTTITKVAFDTRIKTHVSNFSSNDFKNCFNN